MRQFLHTRLEYWFKRLYSLPGRDKEGEEERGRQQEDRGRGRYRGQQKEEICREIKQDLSETDTKDKRRVKVQARETETVTGKNMKKNESVFVLIYKSSARTHAHKP